VLSAFAIVVRVLSHLIEGIGLAFRQRKSLEAEVLFLRRQLAFMANLSRSHHSREAMSAIDPKRSKRYPKSSR
jgi:hypothetical protein